jgi:CubicO group peptidase (beta-lactamase class C family)
MLMGRMVDSNLIQTNETLGDIFDQPEDWEGVRQTEIKKTITLQEILSMTSGLKPCFYQNNIKDQETLQDVLDQVDYEEEFRGKFYYNERSHMLSRIILRRTGLTPREYMEQEGIFTKLGINSTDYSWDTFGGVEGTAVGLKTNPRVHAKLGQLYLQQGLAKVGDQLISKEWIQRSSTNQLAEGDINYLSSPEELDGYGYQGWFVNTPGYTGVLEGFTVAFGVFGQIIAYQPSSNTTISIMGKPPAGSGTSYNFLKNIVENLPHLEVEQPDCDARLRYVKYLRENGGEVSFLLWEQLKRFIRTFGAR